MNFEKSRNLMVEQQLKRRGIKDPRVLEVMNKVPRHLFVDEALQERAYDDYPLPIGEGQTISQPYMVAAMTEALELEGNEKILEIGTGSGYQTAILAELANQVFSIERLAKIARRAREVLDKLGYQNIAIRMGDGTIGWNEFAPYDRVLITAGAPDVPKPLLEQLTEDGKMVIPLGDLYSQVLTVVEKNNSKSKIHRLFGCVFVPLIGKYGWYGE
ncbi:MAG: protein-L-isoaspartate(D-aspartate) O-methyltransferase [Candidatus Edwardsbacteria bacterium]